MKLNRVLGALAIAVAAESPAFAQAPPLVPLDVARALASELSGETARQTVEEIARHHRMRGSRPFRRAADFIVAELKRYGVEDARVEEFPADGSQWYGTQRARPAWDVESAELWEVRNTGGGVERLVRVASFGAMPVALAQDSESGEVTARLVDVGNGTSPADYEGRNVRGSLVLAGAQPGPVAELAVARYGAAGIVSYAQNQRTAWYGEDENLVRWGHFETFAPHKSFGFMVSLKQARQWQQRLARGEAVLLQAAVKAGQHPGAYSIVTATIPGADPARRNDEIVFSCHLDHQRPGANDNASGCATILEVARTFARLIDGGRLARPARTLRFIWPPEIEGTVTYLNARPEVAARIKAAIHLDMVGGGPVTKAVFHVTRGPASLPSFVNDVAAALGAFVNEETMAFASAKRPSAFPLTSREGGKEPLQAELSDFTSGSDHQIYTEGSFRIPAVYLNDWPDRYIHTNFDTPANIDPTKLLRAGFISAATGWVLATIGPDQAEGLLQVIGQQALGRIAQTTARVTATDDPAGLLRFRLWHERTLVESMSRFFEVPPSVRANADRLLQHLENLAGNPPPPTPPSGDDAMVFVRRAHPKGPMAVFGYDYFSDKYGAPRASTLAIFRATARWGDGGYAYEVLNLVDGVRTVRDIRRMVSAIYGPIALEPVVAYLRALVEIGVLEVKPVSP
jgi:hypothetical protein